jgi:hypothetical protein
MGVIISFFLLGGFAQDNIGALMAGHDLGYSATAQDGFCGSLNAIGINNPYGGFDAIIKPEVGLRKGKFGVSLGYFISPFSAGTVTGVPITADASYQLRPFERLSFRPRVSLMGPAHFYSGDPYGSYKLYGAGGGGCDAIYDPFPIWRIRPAFAIGGTAGCAFGDWYSDVTGHEESLQGLGYAGNAAISLIFNKDSWSMILETKASYGGSFVPEITLSFLW